MDNPDPDKPGELGELAARIDARKVEHHVFATSFADPADINRFRRCKARGGSDLECFRVGDNGIGFWSDNTAGRTAMCALPPEKIVEQWGSLDAGRLKPVLVFANQRQVICSLGDTMPHEVNIRNGAGIDLNEAACIALWLRPPVFVRAIWRWLS